MPLPNLRVSREEARKRIDSKLKEGRELRNSMDPFLLSRKELELARLKMTHWVQYVKDLLETLFYNGSVVEQFAPSGGQMEIRSVPTFHEEVAEFLEILDGYLHRLESISGRLDLAREKAPEEQPTGLRKRTQASSDATPTIFISHSSQDSGVKRAVEQGFDEVDTKPVFFEDEIAGTNPARKIAELVKNSEALFVFLTYNSLSQETRDWIVFEVGVALAHEKPIHTWKTKSLQSHQLPKLLEQVTTWREFDLSTSEGTVDLIRQVKRVGKNPGAKS